MLIKNESVESIRHPNVFPEAIRAKAKYTRKPKYKNGVSLYLSNHILPKSTTITWTNPILKKSKDVSKSQLSAKYTLQPDNSGESLETCLQSMKKVFKQKHCFVNVQKNAGASPTTYLKSKWNLDWLLSEAKDSLKKEESKNVKLKTPLALPSLKIPHPRKQFIANPVKVLKGILDPSLSDRLETLKAKFKKIRPS